MRQLFFLYAITLVIFSVQAQETASVVQPNYNLRIEPLRLFNSELSIVADFKISEHWAVGPEIWYKKQSRQFSNERYSINGDTEKLIAGIMLGYGWFWQKFNMVLGAGFDSRPYGFFVSTGDIFYFSEAQVFFETPIAEYTLGWTF